MPESVVFGAQRGELYVSNIDEADPPVAEDVLSEADQRRDQVAQACDAGNYHEGIVMAAETIDMIEEAAEN